LRRFPLATSRCLVVVPLELLKLNSNRQSGGSTATADPITAITFNSSAYATARSGDCAARRGHRALARGVVIRWSSRSARQLDAATPVLGKCRFGCGTHRLTCDTTTAWLTWVETRQPIRSSRDPRVRPLLGSRHARGRATEQLFIAEFRDVRCPPFEATKAWGILRLKTAARHEISRNAHTLCPWVSCSFERI
jgi:hypothetical protein